MTTSHRHPNRMLPYKLIGSTSIAWILFGLQISPLHAESGNGRSLPLTESQNQAIDEKGRELSEIRESHRQSQIHYLAEVQEAQRQLEEFLNLAKIPGTSNDCAVYNNWKRECLSTIGQFNTSLANIQVPGDQNSWVSMAQTVRNSRADQLAAKAYLSMLMERSGKQEEAKNRAEREMNRSIQVQAQSLSKSTMQELFNRYGQTIFLQHPGNHLESLVSTDSNFIDSLYKILTSGGRNRTASSAGWRADTRPLREAPLELIRPTQTLPPGQWSRPFRIKFGFAIARLPPTGLALDQSMEAATPYLLMLVNLPSVFSVTPDKRAKIFYDSNLHTFKKPDTIQMEACLYPLKDRYLKHSDQKSSNESGVSEKLTEENALAPRHFQPLLLSQDDLPPKVAQFLLHENRCCSHDSIETVTLDFGRWLFRKVQVRPGRGIRPFPEVQKSILAILETADTQEKVRGTIEILEKKSREFSESLAQMMLDSSSNSQLETSGSGTTNNTNQLSRAQWKKDHITLAQGLELLVDNAAK